MKSAFWLFFLFTVLCLSTQAQTIETISELKPISASVGKFSKTGAHRLGTGYEKLKFSAASRISTLSNGAKVLEIVIQVIYDELFFVSVGGKYVSQTKLYGRITSREKGKLESVKTDGFFEESQIISEEADTLIKEPFKDLTFRQFFKIPAGKYQIGLILTDLYGNAQGVKVIKFEMP